MVAKIVAGWFGSCCFLLDGIGWNGIEWDGMEWIQVWLRVGFILCIFHSQFATLMVFP